MKEIIYEQGSTEYEKSRVRFFNNAVPDRYPYQIIHPRSTEEVAAAVKHAMSLDKHISVRSGGHLFPHQHLQNDEILIDLKGVNNHFEFDEHTRQINFGPGLTAKDAQDFLNPRNLFFPFGHSPTVGLGGFLLAGGQGWFFPGWGLTSDRWITQLEVVTANGEIKICNRYDNADIFWAARGAGMGFFAIVTRFWGQTAPAKKLYMLQWVFSGSKYHSALNWLLDSGKLLQPYHTELTVSSQYEDAFTDLDGNDEIRSKEILLNGLVIIYADSLEEAQAMSFPFGECPEEHVGHIPLRETTWDEQNMLQEMLMPPNKGLRYKCDSMLTGPEVPREELLDAIYPLFMELPNRRSCGVIVNCGITTGNLAYSLPTDLYIANYLVWKDAKDDLMLKQWLTKVYESAQIVSCGIYVADFDADQRMTKIMSDRAWERWTAIREKWDPKRRVGGFREKNATMNVLKTQPRLRVQNGH